MCAPSLLFVYDCFCVCVSACVCLTVCICDCSCVCGTESVRLCVYVTAWVCVCARHTFPLFLLLLLLLLLLLIVLLFFVGSQQGEDDPGLGVHAHGRDQHFPRALHDVGACGREGRRSKNYKTHTSIHTDTRTHIREEGITHRLLSKCYQHV